MQKFTQQLIVNAALIDATVAGDLIKVKSLLRQGGDINAVDSDKKPLILVAANNLHLDLIKFFLDKGVPIETKNDQGSTTFHYVARNNSDNLEKKISILKFLLERGANIDAVDHEGETALMLAIHFDFIQIRDFLLAKGANVNIANKYGVTPLLSIKLNDINKARENIETLLRHGANINAVTNQGITLMMRVAHNQELVKYLRTQGANPHDLFTNGTTELMRAIQWNDLGLAETLLSKKSDLDQQEKNALKKLTNYDVNEQSDNGVNEQDDSGRSAIMYTSNLGAVKLLLKYGADVNLRDDSGETPLFSATLEISKLLIQNGADVNIVTKSGRTALFYALHNKEKLELLLQSGVTNETLNSKASINPSEYTVLLYAMNNALVAFDDYKESIKLLLKAGADTDIQCRYFNVKKITDQSEQVRNFYQECVRELQKGKGESITKISIMANREHNVSESQNDNSLLPALGKTKV